jgi:hypothetical protein
LRNPWNIGQVRQQLTAELIRDLQPQEDIDMELSDDDSMYMNILEHEVMERQRLLLQR